MLGIAVFVASFAAMAFELAGARALAPYLGGSIEIWTGTIAAVLAGLAVGYWVGGRVADRYPRRELLAGTLFAAGTCVALACFLRDAVPFAVAQSALPLWSAGIVSGLALFTPASVFLGAASPAAAKLGITSLSGSARTVGSLAAWGALGSIAGTVVTGIVLIPNVGTGVLLAGTAGALMLASFGIELRRLWWLRLGLAAGAALLYAVSSPVAFAGTIAERQTPYGWIRVTETETADGVRRDIVTDAYGTQCGANVEPDGTVSTEPIFGYTQLFDIGAALRPEATRALIIGGCNLTYARHLLEIFPDAAIDVVELDPAMTEIAREHFGYRDDPRLAVTHGDARRFLNATRGSYDLIFGDAYNAAASIPHQLATREAAARVRDALGGEGAYVINVYGAASGELATFARSQLATLRAVFPHVRAYTANEGTPRGGLQNVVFVASEQPLPDAGSDALAPYRSREIPLDDFGDGLVLTDDYAPVEALTAAMRRHVLERQ